MSPTQKKRDKQQGVIEGQEALESMGIRESRAKLEFPPLRPPPAHFSEIADTVLQQNARDAWRAASRLEATLRALLFFVVAHEMGISIDDKAQQSLTSSLPGLRDFQLILDHLAVISKPAGSEKEGPRPMGAFPAQALGDMSMALSGWIEGPIGILKALGASWPGRLSKKSRQRFTGLIRIDTDLGCSPPGVRIQPSPDKITTLIKEVQGFLHLLANAPAKALSLCKSGKASKEQLIDVNLEAGTVRIGTTLYSESRPVAAYFRAHMKANSERIPDRKALEMEPKELKGLRLDRLRLKIKHSKLRELLDTNHQGTRLLLDQIALA